MAQNIIFVLEIILPQETGGLNCEDRPLPPGPPPHHARLAAGLEKTGEISATRENISWFSIDRKEIGHRYAVALANTATRELIHISRIGAIWSKSR